MISEYKCEVCNKSFKFPWTEKEREQLDKTVQDRIVKICHKCFNNLVESNIQHHRLIRACWLNRLREESSSIPSKETKDFTNESVKKRMDE